MNEKPSAYENNIVYHFPYTEEFIEVKIHMESPKKYNTARAYVNMMIENLSEMLRLPDDEYQ